MFIFAKDVAAQAPRPTYTHVHVHIRDPCATESHAHMLSFSQTHTHTAGGLGELMVPDSFEVWVCASLPHPCATHNDAVCFTYSEVDLVFVPWAYNSTLKLGKSVRPGAASRSLRHKRSQQAPLDTIEDEEKEDEMAEADADNGEGLSATLKWMEVMMQKAAADMRFEDAARLRDAINVLKQE